jgi:hypothetical protein
MVNTRVLTTQVEAHVRTVLSSECGQNFTKLRLPLSTGGLHEFDAVSGDGLVVASVKSSGGKTASGKHPAGKVNSAIAELYFLSLISAPTKYLVLTSAAFYDIFVKTLEAKIASGIQVRHIPLPNELQELVDGVQREASLEVTPTLDSTERTLAGIDE